MEHASPEQLDVEAVRTALMQETERLQHEAQGGVTATQIDLVSLRQRRAHAALDRLNGGIYGLCCECNLSVEPELLQVDPAAPFCTDCQGPISICGAAPPEGAQMAHTEEHHET